MLTTQTAQPRIHQSDLQALITLGLFLLTTGMFVMIAVRPALTDNQGFMLLAQAVVISGLINGVVAAAFNAQLGQRIAPNAPLTPAAGETTTTTTTATTAPTGDLPQAVTAQTTTTAGHLPEDDGDELPLDQRISVPS